MKFFPIRATATSADGFLLPILAKDISTSGFSKTHKEAIYVVKPF